MKRIAVNTRLLIKDKLEGIGWFTHEVLRRITTKNPDVEFYFFFDRPWSEDFIYGENVKPVALSPQARHPVLYDIWFDFSIKRALSKYNIDLFFSPDGFLSRTTDVPQIPVMHDLNFEHYPDDLPGSTSRYYRKRFPVFANKALSIITVSEASKIDIVDLYEQKDSKVHVVHNGVNDSFSEISEKEKVEVRKHYTEGKQYFVYVGSMHPRKNLARLLRAYNKLRKDNPSMNTRMVLVGEAMWSNKDLKFEIENSEFSEDIILTGRVYHKELNRLISASLALTYVPYFEGFGIPILEGFKCGTAVVTSEISSMPEVAGDAALLVDPFDIDSICNAMNEINKDKNLRSSLIKKGSERVKQFSWDKTADEVWKVIQTELKKL